MVLVILFYIKVGVGILYGLYFNLPKQQATADTWRFYRESLPETQLLLHNPLLFVQSLFMHGYSQTGNLFIGKDSYWNDLKDNIIIKIFAVFNVLSQHNYYTNLIFFNFLFFFGLIAFYRLVKQYSISNNWLLIASVFLMPSFLFWGSGIHKDGLLFSAMGVLLYCIHQLMYQKTTAKFLFIGFLCFTLIFFVKSFIALALIPAILSWWLAVKFNKHHQLYFIAVYTGFLLLIMAMSLLSNHYNPLFYLANKQHEFLLLNGNSAIKVPNLQPTLQSMIHYAPTAIDIALFRPHLKEAKNIAYDLSFAEILLNIGITLTFLWTIKNNRPIAPFFICCFYFGFSVLLLEGYTVTFVGAIVRYRSLVLPIIIAPMVAMISFKNVEERYPFYK